MQGCVPTGCSLSAECLQHRVQAPAEPLDRADQRWVQQQVCGEQTGEPWRAIDVAVAVAAAAAADECPVTLLHSAWQMDCVPSYQYQTQPGMQIAPMMSRIPKHACARLDLRAVIGAGAGITYDTSSSGPAGRILSTADGSARVTWIAHVAGGLLNHASLCTLCRSEAITMW